MKKILFICLLISINAFSQDAIKAFLSDYYNTMDTVCLAPQKRVLDTVKVVLLVCDTARPYYVTTSFTFDSLTDNGWVGHRIEDTAYFNYDTMVSWMFALEVLEKHNTREGVIDPDGVMYVDQYGKIVDYYEDYWAHIKYLTMDKKKLSKGIIVWDSKKIKK